MSVNDLKLETIYQREAIKGQARKSRAKLNRPVKTRDRRGTLAETEVKHKERTGKGTCLSTQVGRKKTKAGSR